MCGQLSGPTGDTPVPLVSLAPDNTGAGHIGYIRDRAGTSHLPASPNTSSRWPPSVLRDVCQRRLDSFLSPLPSPLSVVFPSGFYVSLVLQQTNRKPEGPRNSELGFSPRESEVLFSPGSWAELKPQRALGRSQAEQRKLKLQRASGRLQAEQGEDRHCSCGLARPARLESSSGCFLLEACG